MSEKSSSGPLKIIGFVVLVFAVGIAGVFAGHVLRGRLPGSQERDVTMRAPTSLLKSGMMFPDAVVVGEDGSRIHTGELIGGSGCVVLFLDLDCPPCEEMAIKWQDAIDDGVLALDQLWGITFHPRPAVDDYIETHGVVFPVLVDTLRTFLREYEVNRFPLEIVVGSSGKIRSTSYNSRAQLDPRRLAEMLAD